MSDLISNVLAERYATPPMRAIWSGEGKVKLERELWIAVMKAQLDLGLTIPDNVIESFERVKDQVDLESIMNRERVTRHDVKARIEEFCSLAAKEYYTSLWAIERTIIGEEERSIAEAKAIRQVEQIHKGMTSRDLTENVEQLQVFRSLQVIRTKAVAALIKIAERAQQLKDIPLTARTHNVAAQVTTVGKRIAMFGEEMLGGFIQLESVIGTYPARGLKGAVGTRLDEISLFNGDASKARALDEKVVAYLGLPQSLDAVGQVYPRSLDFRVISALVDLASGPGDFARTLRLMAGHELASEGFAKGQVGSSAMPHKMNSRSCERINGLHVILKGYLAMAAGLAGDQWNEGDVSCSVVRRVMLPDAFLAMDGLLETLLTVLNQMEAFEAVVATELQRYLPFLLTTTVLMEAVKTGAGREGAHEAIKEHAVAVARDMRTGKVSTNDLFTRLAADSRLGLTPSQFEAIFEKGRANSGDAAAQVENFASKVAAVAAEHPEGAAYQPGDIL